MNIIINPHIYSGNLYDDDALAFITAAQITSSTQKSAIDNLVFGLKEAELWGKFPALYPFVGGSANSHKYNLKKPLDDDASFRLTFVGGWNHSPTGAKPTNAYADTHLVQNTVLSANGAGLSYYSRENIVAPAYNVEMGAFSEDSEDAFYESIKRTSVSDISHVYIGVNGSGPSYISATSAVFLTGTRINNADLRVYENGVQRAADFSVNSNGATAFPVYLAALNYNGGASYFSNRECAFAAIDSGLTASEVAVFYELVQAFQVALGREV